MKFDYLRLASAFLLISTLQASATVLYVDVNSTSPTPPYTNWATAANVIQDAVAASTNGDTILVTNGVYNAGSYDYYDAYDYFGLSRVVLTNAVTVRSANGPTVTTIQGYQLPGITNGTGAIRCAFLFNGGALSGFTLTGGGTLTSGASADGGGVYCRGLSTVSNCVISGNSAGIGGGGARSGTLRNCLLSGNRAVMGGGAHGALLYNCTLTGNSATTSGGGAYQGGLYNCIAYYNFAPSNPNCVESIAAMNLAYCCTTPLPFSGPGHIGREPLFVNRLAGDFRLQTNSPCINSGNNAFLADNSDLDLDNKTRITGGTVDIGAYEFQYPTSTLSYAWLQQYGLPTDGSADFLDLDHDGANNWQEWMAGTVPTNALSILKLSSPTGDVSGITVRWQSVWAKKYFLQRSTNLYIQPAFTLSISNLFGQAGTTAFKDTTATGTGPYFYRVGIQ